MRTFALIGACVVAAGVLSGCNQGGGKTDGYKAKEPEELKTVEFKEGTPGAEDVLFPFAVGNQWDYEVEIDQRKKDEPARTKTSSSLTLRCTNVTKIGTMTKATIEAVMDDQISERQMWLRTKSGLFQLSVGMPSVPYNPYQPAFRIPLKAGGEFEWAGQGFLPDGSVGEGISRSKVNKMTYVDTMMGRVQAYGVDTLLRWRDGQAASTTWYAPGIGIVRYRQEVVAKNGSAIQIMRLKSYRLSDTASPSKTEESKTNEN